MNRPTPPADKGVGTDSKQYPGKEKQNTKKTQRKHKENNNTRRRAKTESEVGHFMDSKENKLYYFIQLELLRLKHLAKLFGEE